MQSKPLMIAHRGYSAIEKENTLVAFTAAGNDYRYYGIETDVHITKDGKYIIIHDETTDRITNNRVKLNVEENDYETIRQVRLPDVDGSLNRDDLKISLMEEYFKICKKYNKVAVCELKQLFNLNQIKEIIKIVTDLGMIKNTIFISFYIEDLIQVKSVDESINCQYLLCDFKDEYVELLKKNNLDVDVLYRNITKEQIELCHQNNIKVNIWTVDNQDDANLYASYGVDYITSNALKETF